MRTQRVADDQQAAKRDLVTGELAKMLFW